MANVEEKLSPPLIDNKLPAFYGSELDITFTLTKAVSAVDFDKVRVLIKTMQNNIVKVDYEFDTIYKDVKTHTYHVRVNLDSIPVEEGKEKFVPLVGQYYKV